MLTAAVFDESQTPAAVGRIWPLLVATPASRDMVDRHQLPLSTNGARGRPIFFLLLTVCRFSLSLRDVLGRALLFRPGLSPCFA